MGAAGFGGSFAPLCGVALKFLIEYQYVLIGFSQQSDTWEFGVFLAPPLGWCAAQRIRISMIASGNHTTIHAVTALAVAERVLSAPYGGTSPKGRGKRGIPTNSNLSSG